MGNKSVHAITWKSTTLANTGGATVSQRELVQQASLPMSCFCRTAFYIAHLDYATFFFFSPFVHTDLRQRWECLRCSFRSKRNFLNTWNVCLLVAVSKSIPVPRGLPKYLLSSLLGVAIVLNFLGLNRFSFRNFFFCSVVLQLKIQPKFCYSAGQTGMRVYKSCVYFWSCPYFYLFFCGQGEGNKHARVGFIGLMVFLCCF